MEDETKKKEIISLLQEVYDPEIPINVYDLGLIYEINIEDNGLVHILMTLTSPTCPTADYIKAMVEEAAMQAQGVEDVEVELTFEPQWNPDMVSEESKEELGLTTSSLEKTEDLSVQRVFTGNDEGAKEHVCFNCGATDKDRPVLSCKYKGENVFICTHCMIKF